MKFAAILIGVTILTSALIFGVYKLFLQPATQNSDTKLPVAITGTQTSLPIQAPPQASSSAPAPASPSPTSKPKASTFKSTIGTLTVLQNNTGNQTSSPASVGNSTISGIINFSGTAPTGTSIVIVARANGTTDAYKTVISGIAASSNSTWSWTLAQTGKVYDMIVILKGSSGGVDTDYAASQTYVVTAPALNQIFSVNAASAPSAPTGTITTTCYSHNSNNTWYAYVNFPTVSLAQVYKLQVGTASGGSDLANTTQNAQSGTNQIISVTINDSISYYSQYAYASVPNPTSAQYSAFSTPMKIKCP